MRRILDQRADDFVPVESELEARFLEVVRAAGLPEPVRQLDVGDTAAWIGRVDFAYPAAGLLSRARQQPPSLLEVDQEADRARDARLAPAGWRTTRFRWDDIVDGPHHVIDRVRQSSPALRHEL